MTLDLTRLVTAAHDRAEHLPSTLPVRDFYNRAAVAAEQRISGELGTYVAGHLAMAAESCRVRGWNSPLGEHKTTLALALAVLDLPDPQRCG